MVPVLDSGIPHGTTALHKAYTLTTGVCLLVPPNRLFSFRDSFDPSAWIDSDDGDAAATVVNMLATLRELGIRADDLAFDYPGVSIVIRDLRYGHMVLLGNL